MIVTCTICRSEFEARVRVEVWLNLKGDEIVYGATTARGPHCKGETYLGKHDAVFDLAGRVSLDDFGQPCPACGEKIDALVAVKPHRTGGVYIACGNCFRALPNNNTAAPVAPEGQPNAQAV